MFGTFSLHHVYRYFERGQYLEEDLPKPAGATEEPPLQALGDLDDGFEL